MRSFQLIQKLLHDFIQSFVFIHWSGVFGLNLHWQCEHQLHHIFFGLLPAYEPDGAKETKIVVSRSESNILLFGIIPELDT